ncbi:MAG TPA: hypothetical protein VG815_07655 [Chloroflexota bacterium]|nr:hypothetical protein [Chloroflexota bacterium]
MERIRPDVGAHDQGKSVLVATVWSEPMAQSWAQMLRNNGIPAMVKAGGPGFSLGGPPPLGFETYILAPESLAKRAGDILEGFAEPGLLELNEEHNEQSSG